LFREEKSSVGRIPDPILFQHTPIIVRDSPSSYGVIQTWIHRDSLVSNIRYAIRSFDIRAWNYVIHITTVEIRKAVFIYLERVYQRKRRLKQSPTRNGSRRSIRLIPNHARVGIFTFGVRGMLYSKYRFTVIFGGNVE